MALQFERRHLTFLTWYHKRQSGNGGTAAPAIESCILLTSDAGTDDKEALLTTDTGTDTLCAQLTTSTT